MPAMALMRLPNPGIRMKTRRASLIMPAMATTRLPPRLRLIAAGRAKILLPALAWNPAPFPSASLPSS